VRDWPLLLVTAAFCFGAAARYIAEDGMDSLAFGAALFAAASFGAWLYSLGQSTPHEKGKPPS
jgi:hypothetical protein